MAFGGDGCVVGSACNLVQALESRQNDTVPYITNAPVSFQSVGDCTAARNDMFIIVRKYVL